MTRTRAVSLMLIAVAVAVVLAVAAIVATRTSAFREWLAATIERQGERYLTGDLSIGRVEGDLFNGIELRDVRVTRDGESVVTADRIRARYDLLDLLSGPVALPELTIERPVVHVRREDGELNIANLIASGSDRGPAAAFALEDVTIVDGAATFAGFDPDGALTIPERIDDIDASLSVSRSNAGGSLQIALDALSFRSRNPGISVERVAGSVGISGDLVTLDGLDVRTEKSRLALDGSISLGSQNPRVNLRVAAPTLDTPELSRVIPALKPLEISPSLTASLDGTLDELAVDVDMRSEGGTVRAMVVADASGPEKSVKGGIGVTDFDVSAFSDLDESRITTEGQVDLRFGTRGGTTQVSGTYDLDIPEFVYGEYQATNVDAKGRIADGRVHLDVEGDTLGGRVMARGTIDLPIDNAPLRYDLDGHVADIDPQELPEGIVDTPIRPEGRSTLDFRASGSRNTLDADVRFHDFSFAGAEFERGTRVRVARRDGRLRFAINGAVSGLDPQRLGRQLDASALSVPRYRGDVNARLDLTGSGTSLDTLSLDGTAVLADSQLFGGHIPSMTLTFDLTRGSGLVSARGNFESIDLGRVAAHPRLHGTLTGMIDLTATLPPDTPDTPMWSNLDASGQILITNGTLSGLHVGRAIVAGTIDRGVAQVARLDVTGPDLRIEASGTLAFNRFGDSDFTYLIDTPPLQQIEAIDAPIQGELLLKGRVTGNLDELRIAGTAAGARLGYRDASALAVDGSYEVRVPDLQLADAAANVVASITSLRVAGRDIDDLNAEVEYVDQALTFSADGHEGSRSVTAEGRLLWQPDRQRVELARLVVGSGTVEWGMPAGREAIIEYGGERLTIDGLRLDGGAGQMLSIDGELGGGPAAGLSVRAENVRLSELDTLLDLDRQLQGQVDAQIRVTGPLKRPSAEGTVAITDGGVEGFAYQSLTGTFDYQRRALAMDARLTTAEGGYLDAKGRVPVGGNSTVPLDLRIDSSSIGLGLVQGMTDEITEVSGSMQVQMHATGTLRNPRLNGFIDIDQGAFTLVLAQNHYTGLDTRVVFSGDVAEIETFTLLDDDRDPLQVSGHVMTLGGGPREFALVVQSDQFAVMDNRFGDIDVAADLRISGDLTRPRIIGTAEIEAGTIHLDELLEVLYGLRGAVSAPSDGGGPDRSPMALSADIRLVVPDALIVNGTDLPAPGELPTGMGDVNLTIGGELRIIKPPDGTMTVVGDIHAVRGTYEFQGREFEVARGGSVRFSGGELNPALDLTAERVISSVLTRVHVGGTLDDPVLELSSQPPLDDGEILSLIVFNQSLNSLGAAQQVSLAHQALALAAGLVTDRVAESLADELALDVLELRLADGGTPSVTVGEQLGDDVYVKVRQQLGSQAASALLLEYELADWVRLVARFAEQQGTAENLFNRIDRGRIALEFTVRY
jgi:autotransporter translocation and assembly factor TamB